MRLSLHMLILYSPKSACKCISISQGTCVADWMTSMMMHAHGNSDDHIVTMTRANPKVSTRNRCVHDRTWGRNQHVLHDLLVKQIQRSVQQADPTQTCESSQTCTPLCQRSSTSINGKTQKPYRHQRQSTGAVTSIKSLSGTCLTFCHKLPFKDCCNQIVHAHG